MKAEAKKRKEKAEKSIRTNGCRAKSRIRAGSHGGRMCMSSFREQEEVGAGCEKGEGEEGCRGKWFKPRGFLFHRAAS